MTDYAAILVAKYPNSHWILDGDSLDGLTWLSDEPKPTKKELDALWPEVQQAVADKAAADAAARDAAIAHAKSLGFTDEMIAVMYPGLTV
jgi:hypothetical protein